MKRASGRLVPFCTAAAAVGPMLAACQIVPDTNAAPAPIAAASSQPPAAAAPAKGKDAAQRSAAIAEMRARGAATESMPYPDAFAGSRNARLAARPEPRAVADVASIRSELAAVARRQQSAVSPAEIEALKARAAALQRLLAQTQAGAAAP